MRARSRPYDPNLAARLPLKVDGWARTATIPHSQTVEPLPFHGMVRYPYSGSGSGRSGAPGVAGEIQPPSGAP